MKFCYSILTLTLIAVAGCNSATQDTSTESETVGATFDPKVYPDELQPFLTKLNDLIGQYNTDAKGIELSEHGVRGQLDDAAAKEMANFANSLLAKINENFDKSVCRTIDESWYQVPSRFNINETDSHDGTALTFTVSHHHCGLHEFDFVIENGTGRVIADRYDSLGILW